MNAYLVFFLGLFAFLQERSVGGSLYLKTTFVIFAIQPSPPLGARSHDQRYTCRYPCSF